MSSKQRRIKRKLNIIIKTYRQYRRVFSRDGSVKAEPIFADQDHRARKLHAKHGDKLNARWAKLLYLSV